MKFNYKHFKFELEPQKISKLVWNRAIELKKNKIHTDIDKFYLQDFRFRLKTLGYNLYVTHIPTGIKCLYKIKTIPYDKKKYINHVIKELQRTRDYKKQSIITSHNFYGAKYNKIGGVFTTSNQINEISKKCNWNDPLMSKTPRSISKRYIGIELEFNSISGKYHTTESIAKLFKDQNLGKYVHCGTDGSCGFEVRVLVTEDEYQEILPKIMKVLTDEGFNCDTRCGTHVHLDMRKRDIKQVYKNFFYTQSFLRKFLIKSRKRNKFCKVNEYESFEEQTKIYNRYRGINPFSYNEHKTLEIRMHHGTLDPKELIPWIRLLLTIANYEGNLDKKVLTLKQASEKYNINESFKQELTTRLGSLFSIKGA